VKEKKGISVRLIALVGVLAAIYFVLSLLSVGTNNFKASFESLAVLVGALTLGPIPGMLVGLVGEFVHQLVAYGLDPTTPLWLLPYMLEGLFVGLLVRKDLGNIPKTKLITAIIAGEIFLTAVVTPVNWAAAVIQGWGNWAVIAAGIPLRLGIMAVRIAVYVLVLPILYPRLRKVVKPDAK
jgi:ECF transporter S component (folate family)